MPWGRAGTRLGRAGRTCGTSRRRSCGRARRRRETSPRCSLGGAVSMRSGRARHQERDRVLTRARSPAIRAEQRLIITLYWRAAKVNAWRRNAHLSTSRAQGGSCQNRRPRHGAPQCPASPTRAWGRHQTRGRVGCGVIERVRRDNPRRRRHWVSSGSRERPRRWRR